MEKDEVVRVIKDAIEKIPNEDYKIALKLKLQGLKLREITEVVASQDMTKDKTNEAIKNDFKRGKQLLKEKLKLCYQDE